MTQVLVAYATKMGGTQEIAETIARELGHAGIFVTLRDAADVTAVDQFDAAVIGSALYQNRWRSDAVDLLRLLAHRAETGRAIPTWLFHSGPCGPDAATPRTPAPEKVKKYARVLGAAPVVTFGGRLQPDTATGFLARHMARGPLAGDFRDLDSVRNWARTIADHLAHPHGTQTRTHHHLPAPQNQPTVHAGDAGRTPGRTR